MSNAPAAITTIFGVIVHVMNGYVMFLPTSNFGSGLLDVAGYMGAGKIEYRFKPEFGGGGGGGGGDVNRTDSAANAALRTASDRSESARRGRR